MATAKRKRLSLLLGSLICSSIAFLLVGDSGTITKATVITQTVKAVEPTRQDDKKPDQVPEVTPPTQHHVKKEEESKEFIKNAVVSLNPETFEQKLSFNPGCGHCIQFAPIYREFGQLMIDHQYLHVGEVSCSNYLHTCTSQGVHNLPTVFLYYKGQKQSFRGQHNARSLQQFVEDNIKQYRIGE